MTGCTVSVFRVKRRKCLFAQVKYFEQRFGAGAAFAHDDSHRQESCKRFDRRAAKIARGCLAKIDSPYRSFY